MNIFISLITAHLFTDFVLQTKTDVIRKSELLFFLKHITLTSVLAYLLVGVWSLWYIIPLVFVLHGLIDFIKLKLSPKFNEYQFLIFLIDQIMHFLSLITISYLFAGSEAAWISSYVFYYYDVLIFISALILITKAGGIAVGLFVKPFVDQLKNFEDRGFINGGKIIGYLERFLIVLFIITGNFSSVGFLIAAKSIFRFGELLNSHNRKEAEYIIIGTFSSFSYAIVIGFTLNNYIIYFI